MKLAFDANLAFQLEAVEAVVDAFGGQEPGRPLQMERMLDRVRAVQRRGGLEASGRLQGWNDPHFCPHLSVQMETGTGKTYVYLRTIFELWRRYGFSKFIVVVPTVAIREGVLKNIDITSEHFHALYRCPPYESFCYASRRLHRLRHFATSPTLQLMIMNIDAFRKSQGNVIYRESDRLDGRPPIEFVQAVRPIVIIDEPQSVDNTDLGQDAIKALHPRCTLRYSATHRNPYNLLYRLDAVRAFELGLVKQIVVASAAADGREAMWRAQIRHTVRRHLEKELQLQGRGIKVLSLFFVDRVASYREYDENHLSVRGPIARMLEEELADLSNHPRYHSLPWLRGAPVSLHGGYFACDRKGFVKDTRGDSQADENAYALIMHEKERLLSEQEPLRFIFSHSALREGWDNPNVFQICTLAHSKSVIKKRQEIGRGLRLPVDQNGQRVFDAAINQLYVMANESYEEFARALQTEYREECGATLTATDLQRHVKRHQDDDLQRPAASRPHACDLLRLDTEQLIERTAAALRRMPALPKAMLQVTSAKLQITREGIRPAAHLHTRERLEEQTHVPDLLSHLQTETELTRATLARILLESGRLDEALVNPSRFLDEATAIIQRELRASVAYTTSQA